MFNFKKGKKILLVDDEPEILKTLRKLFEKDGYDVITFEDPLLAVAALKTEKVDLILTDLKMPKMNGLQLLDQVKNLHPDIPVILLTAFTTIDTAVEAIRWGAFTYLMKPFDIQKVREAADSALWRPNERIIR